MISRLFIIARKGRGSNYPEEQIAGREIVAAYGGQVALVPITEPTSVSDLIRRIRQIE